MYFNHPEDDDYVEVCKLKESFCQTKEWDIILLFILLH